MLRRRTPTVDPQLQRLRAHAQQLIVAKRNDLAEGVLRQILTIAPNDGAANRSLALCLLNLRRLDEAHEQAQRALAIDPASHWGLGTLGSVLLELGRHEEAISAFLQALEIKADFTLAIFGLAIACGRKAKWEQAIKWAERGLAIQPNHIGMLHIRGEALAALDRREEALATMEHFLRLAPDAFGSHHVASVIYRRLKEFDKASEFAHRAMEMNPANPYMHNSLAQLKLREHKFEDADRHFKSAAEIYDSRRDGQKGSRQIEIRSLLGQAAVNLNKRDLRVAESQYRRILEIEAAHPLARALLAGAIGAQGRFDEALPLAQEAVQQQPKGLIPRVSLANILADMERHDAALAEAHRGLELFPDSDLLHRMLAGIYIDLEDFTKAMHGAKKAEQLKPGPLSDRVMAAVLAGLGRREEAVAAIEASLLAEPDRYSSHAAAGYVFKLLGEYERAESHLLRAMELDVAKVGCYEWLGLVYFAQGRNAEARPLLEKAIAINPHQRRVRAALKELGNAGEGGN